MKTDNNRQIIKGDLDSAVKRYEGILNGTIKPPKIKDSPRVRRLMAIFNLTDKDVNDMLYSEEDEEKES